MNCDKRIALRLPEDLITRADVVVRAWIEKNDETLLLTRLTRSAVLRLALLRGIKALEAELVNESSG